MTCLLQTIKQVDNAICQIESIKKYYSGWYLSTDLDNVILMPKHFVLILVIHKNKSVGHFIIAHRINHERLNIFCSLGTNPVKYGLNDFIHANTINTFRYSTVKLQSNRSSCCAYFCLFYLYKIIVNSLDFEQFLQVFEHKQIEENENIVYDFVNKYFMLK